MVDLSFCFTQVVNNNLPYALISYLSTFSFLSGGFSVFAGVGERTREGNDLYREMIESGVIKLGEKQVWIILFFMMVY